MSTSQKIMRNLMAPLFVGLVSTSLGCTGIMSSMYADSVLYPNRQPVRKTPKDYGMNYEDITFKSDDGVELKGWLLPGNKDKIIIMTHPGSFTRYGYSKKDEPLTVNFYDKDVEFLATAKRLRDDGYWVMMFDFRNHGQSGKSANGGITGVGLVEYNDVVGAVDYIRKDPRLANMPIGLVSFCQGANATIIALSKAKERLKDRNITAAVLVQPISLKVFLYQYARDAGLSEEVLVEAEKKCVERGGFPWDKMSPMEYAKDFFVPALVVQAKGDPWTTMDDIKGIYGKLPEPKEMLWLDLKKRFDTYNYFGEHPEAILAFFGKHMREDSKKPN